MKKKAVIMLLGLSLLLGSCGRAAQAGDEPRPAAITFNYFEEVKKPFQNPIPKEVVIEEETIIVEEPILTYVGNWITTAYCPCELCCGDYATGYTASGTLATEGRTVATFDLPFGTKIYIDGLGEFIVEDNGVEGGWIDIFFNSHEDALNYGMRNMDIYIIEE